MVTVGLEVHWQCTTRTCLHVGTQAVHTNAGNQCLLLDMPDAFDAVKNLGVFEFIGVVVGVVVGGGGGGGVDR